MVEVRGDPHGVFRPREGGLTRIRCFRVVSCCVVVVVPPGKDPKIVLGRSLRRRSLLKNLRGVCGDGQSPPHPEAAIEAD